METIIPYLHAWASTEVAEKAQAITKPRSSFFDHLEPNTYLGLGGNKKSRKLTKKHCRRRARKRKRTRKKTKRKRKRKRRRTKRR